MAADPISHPDSLELRSLRPEHVDVIEDIEGRSYRTPWSRGMFLSEIGKPTSICIGAFLGERLVGYMIISRYVDAWHIMNLAVDPDFRRRGVATALLAEMMRRTERQMGRGYTLEVRVTNLGAIQLYEELGFRRRGIRRGYYTDNAEDALIMWRDAPQDDSAGE